MRSFFLYRKKAIFVLTTLLCFSSFNAQCQIVERIAETASLILPQIVQLAAAVMYRIAINSQHTQQLHWTPPTTTTTPQQTISSFYMPGSSSAHNPLDAIRFQGIQNLRQNQPVIELFERYKPQIPSYSHGPSYTYVASGASIPHGHPGSSGTTSNPPASFSIPVPQGFGLPQLPNFFSQPTVTHINIPHIQGTFRIPPPNVGSVNNGISWSIGSGYNRPLESSADYIVQVENPHAFHMKFTPAYRQSYYQFTAMLAATLFQTNGDFINFEQFITNRLNIIKNCKQNALSKYSSELVKAYLIGPIGFHLEGALTDLLNIYFNENGEIATGKPEESAVLIMFNFVRKIAGPNSLNAFMRPALDQKSRVYTPEMIQRAQRGEKPGIQHRLSLDDYAARIFTNPFNTSLLEFSKIAVSSNIYDVENSIANTPEEHRPIAQKFMDLYLSWLQFSKPDLYNQFKNFDRYGMPRIYSADHRWRLLSHDEKQTATASPDSKKIMESLFDTRQTIGKRILNDIGLSENVLSEMSSISKAIWDLIDYTMHPSELSQARIAQAFDAQTYRFKHGNNAKLEDLLKKAFASEQEFKAKVGTFAGKPDIPYSPQDLNEPPLEPKQDTPASNTQPQAASSTPTAQPGQPEASQSEAGSMPHIGCTNDAPIPHVEIDGEDFFDLSDLENAQQIPTGSNGEKPHNHPNLQNFATTGGPKNGTEPEGLKNCNEKKSPIIKNFREGAFDLRHIFSEDHTKNGIDQLASSREEIIRNFEKIIKNVDTNGLLCEGSNQIHTEMNGHQAEIRLFIKNGEILKVDGFNGWSSRVIGNLVKIK